jgi:RNA polymerase sigma factor (sigma-70 family)
MTDDENQFQEFLASIRSGDACAAQRLVTQYESLLRREIRFRLRDSRLRRVLDSGDVCQSVLASFFIRATAGQFDLNDEQDMLHLLISMAKRKSAAVARREYQQKRDIRQSQSMGEHNPEQHNLTSPSQQVSYEEMARLLEQELNDEEREIVSLRNDGCSWQDIASKLGGSADQRRMQLARATERVCKRLGLGDEE